MVKGQSRRGSGNRGCGFEDGDEFAAVVVELSDCSIDAEKARQVVHELAQARLSNSLVQAVALLRQRNNQGVVNSLNDLLACDKAVPATPVSWEVPEELADLFLVYLKSDQAPEKVARVQYLLNISDSTAESLRAMKYKGSSNGSAEQEDIEHEHPVKAFGLAAIDSSGHLSPFKFSRNSPEGQLVMMMCGVEAVQRQLRSTTCPATSPSVLIAFASSPTAASILSGATPTVALRVYTISLPKSNPLLSISTFLSHLSPAQLPPSCGLPRPTASELRKKHHSAEWIFDLVEMEKLSDYIWKEAYSVVEQADGRAEQIHGTDSLQFLAASRIYGA
ncbi:hypothetical protein SASPL_120814 [Salvia splendens]|uniref:Uncharacterized protein n=1 Tax=Salvia splendens TaxID=180675 RepID=A0A8X8XUZ0_SALSN|nr:hypothetical protein SASPL_120814 [Salvia splendens]